MSDTFEQSLEMIMRGTDGWLGFGISNFENAVDKIEQEDEEDED